MAERIIPQNAPSLFSHYGYRVACHTRSTCFGFIALYRLEIFCNPM